MSEVVSRSRDSATRASADEVQTRNVSGRVVLPEPSSLVATSVSRYVVLAEAGRGGMGRVLRAYDPKLQREVALKELSRDSLDAAGTRRLVAEARAMAKLSHPNVVAVYDVEELEDGDVILVMEYVAGQTLQHWLRDGQRPWREVVNRFIAAGRGLVAAHDAGLLHRDFKPANVLLGESQQVKVTDFGLAKAHGKASSSGASSQGQASGDALTEAGKVMGTPRYMAPEQHWPPPAPSPGSGGQDDSLTTAADQYAFCVALWEALCGEPPFGGETMAEDKVSGPPAWPRAATPRPIAEAIVRGLSAQPHRRWPSMQTLLDALAWDPAHRRNRLLLVLGGATVLGLGSVSYGSWAHTRAQRCSGAEQRLAGIWDDARSRDVQAAMLGIGRSYALPAWERIQRELDGYASAWAAMHTDACEATTIRKEQSPQMLDLRMMCLHRAAVDLQATVETLADADELVVQKAHEVTAALRPVSRCADTEALAAEVEPPLPEETEAVNVARRELARARSLERAGRYEDAWEAIEKARTAATDLAYGPVQAELALEEGSVLDRIGEYDASEVALTEALGLAAQLRQWEVMGRAATQLLYVVGCEQQRVEEALGYRSLAEGLSHGQPKANASFRANLASLLVARGEYEAAEAEHRAALSELVAIVGTEFHPSVAMSRNNLANALREQGKLEEAESEQRAALSLWEAALGPDHPNVGMSRNNLATILHARGKFAEAEAEYRAARSLWEAALGPEHPDVAMSRNNLGNVLVSQGRDEEAEAEYRAVLPLLEKSLGPDHPNVAMSRNGLAGILHKRGRYEEAEAEYRAVLSVWERALGSDHPNAAMSRSNVAGVLQSRGKHEEAEAEHRAALTVLEKALGPDNPNVAQLRNSLASVLQSRGKHEEAEAEYRTALSVLEKVLGPNHPSVAASRANIASVLLELDRPDEGLVLAEGAWLQMQRDDIPIEARAQTAFVLARILWTIDAPSRDRHRALRLAEDALRSHEAGAANADAIREIRQWLDEHPLT